LATPTPFWKYKMFIDYNLLIANCEYEETAEAFFNALDNRLDKVSVEAIKQFISFRKSEMIDPDCKLYSRNPLKSMANNNINRRLIKMAQYVLDEIAESKTKSEQSVQSIIN